MFVFHPSPAEEKERLSMQNKSGVEKLTMDYISLALELPVVYCRIGSEMMGERVFPRK
jgi:hypothetical protein